MVHYARKWRGTIPSDQIWRFRGAEAFPAATTVRGGAVLREGVGVAVRKKKNFLTPGPQLIKGLLQPVLPLGQAVVPLLAQPVVGAAAPRWVADWQHPPQTVVPLC